MIAIPCLAHDDRTPGNKSELHAHPNVLRAVECIKPLHRYEAKGAQAKERVHAHDALRTERRHGRVGRV